MISRPRGDVFNDSVLPALNEIPYVFSYVENEFAYLAGTLSVEV